MRLLIIVTTDYPEYKLWELTAGWPAEQPLGEAPVVRVASVGDDRVVVLCQSPSALADADNDAYKEWEIRADITKTTTAWVTAIAAAPRYGEGVEVYVAQHYGYVDVKAVGKGLPAGRALICAPFNHLPDAPGLDALFDALQELLKETSPRAFESALRAVRKKQEGTRAQRLTTLKHRLAHLFLPISVDLQAWGRFNFDDEYMREMIESYRVDSGRLDAARELLYGPQAGQRPESDSVEKIVKEVGLERGAVWADVRALLPRREPGTDAERDAAASYSEVFQRLDLLGSLGDAGKLGKLKTALRTGNPFCAWYSELDAALGRLREALERKERA